MSGRRLAEMSGSIMTTLANLREGTRGVIVALRGGIGLQRKLADMGLNPGCRFELIGVVPGGRVMLDTNHGKLALGHGMAEQVLVKIKEDLL